MNEHIAYFNRWQQTYLMWVHSNFDRIVAETVVKHKKAMEEEKEKSKPLHSYAELMNVLTTQLLNKYADEFMKDHAFFNGSQWKVVSDDNKTIKIKNIPHEELYAETRVPSSLSSIRKGFHQWLSRRT